MASNPNATYDPDTLRAWIRKAEADPSYAKAGQVERWRAMLEACPGAQDGANLEAALGLGARGWAVFPCGPDKAPRTRNGYKDATTNPEQIRQWWTADPGAAIGLACGASGLVVVDCDVKTDLDGITNFDALGIEHAGALHSRTPSGGLHVVFTDTTGGKIRNSAGKLAPGVDVRADGGYIVAPPSSVATGSYEPLDDWNREPMPLPDALTELLQAPKPPTQAPTTQAPRPYGGSPSPYGAAALANEAAKVRAAAEGTRNHTLNAAAFSLGQLIAGGELDRATVEAELMAAALGAGLPEAEARRTLDSGLQAGLLEPRSRPTPPAPPAVTGATPDDTPRAKDLFWTDKNPPKTADYVNVLEALGYRFRMNVCTDTVEVNGDPISDVLAAKIRTRLRDLNYTRVNVAEDAWTAHAYDNRYHPVQEFLGGLTWDGRDTIGRLVSYFDWDRGNLPAFLKRWLVGAVARAYEPQSTQNRLLALDGPQGTGKSYFARWLASALDLPGMFVEGPIDPDDKDNLLRLVSAWIWEVSELSSTTRKADRDALKYFLSMQQVTVRKPYGHYDLVKPALASFVGTVNDVGGFLDDATGSRRFMSVHLTRIDWGYARLDPRQVWAQAKALYDAGEPWALTPEETEEADQTNASYTVSDPLEDLLGRLYELTGNPNDVVSTVDIRDALNAQGWQLRNPRAEAMAIAAVFRAWGLSPEKVSIGGKRERGYVGVRAL